MAKKYTIIKNHHGSTILLLLWESERLQNLDRNFRFKTKSWVTTFNEQNHKKERFFYSRVIPARDPKATWSKEFDTNQNWFSSKGSNIFKREKPRKEQTENLTKITWNRTNLPHGFTKIMWDRTVQPWRMRIDLENYVKLNDSVWWVKLIHLLLTKTVF